MGIELNRNCVCDWLWETNPDHIETLRQAADEARRIVVGNTIRLRGLVEISNHCVCLCRYCGIRAPRRLERYRMNLEEIMDCARRAVMLKYDTLVLQSGEDPGITRDWMCLVVRRIKRETNLAVTLSLGERSEEDLAAWREAGADRYLLKIETSDPKLYESIRPDCGQLENRLNLLRAMKEMGYETGSGVMVGIPGQDIQSLADDILLLAKLDLHMIAVGPYIPHPGTPLGGVLREISSEQLSQVYATDFMTCRVIALMRILCPGANIPATTALATINPSSGWEIGLWNGANVLMPNLTPPMYKALYDIYPCEAQSMSEAEPLYGTK